MYKCRNDIFLIKHLVLPIKRLTAHLLKENQIFEEPFSSVSLHSYLLFFSCSHFNANDRQHFVHKDLMKASLKAELDN